eukprot:3097503-Pyramimonas_sp.AAC.1
MPITSTEMERRAAAVADLHPHIPQPKSLPSPGEFAVAFYTRAQRASSPPIGALWLTGSTRRSGR